MQYVGMFFTFVIVAVLSVIYQGYAFSVLWEWFVTPTFNIRPLNIPESIGLALLLSLSCKNIDSDSNEKSDFAKSVFITLVRPTLALLTGWIVTLFM